MKKLFLAGLLAAAAATASITPDLTVSAGPTFCTENAGPLGPCTFTYSASLPSEPGHRVQMNDFFTIYNFYGFAGNIQSPAGWEGSFTLLTTPTNPPTTPNNLAVANITWKYILAAPSTGPWTGFSADSDFHFARPDGAYNSQAHKNSAAFPAIWTPDGKVGSVPVPSERPFNDDVPEPMSMALLGSGLGALAVLRFRKQK